MATALLSRPDFSAFVKAAPDLTLIFSGPTNGGEEIEIRHVCRQSRGGFITVLNRRTITMYHGSTADRRGHDKSGNAEIITPFLSPLHVCQLAGASPK